MKPKNLKSCFRVDEILSVEQRDDFEIVITFKNGTVSKGAFNNLEQSDLCLNLLVDAIEKKQDLFLSQSNESSPLGSDADKVTLSNDSSNPSLDEFMKTPESKNKAARFLIICLTNKYHGYHDYAVVETKEDFLACDKFLTRVTQRLPFEQILDTYSDRWERCYHKWDYLRQCSRLMNDDDFKALMFDFYAKEQA